jgi:invasion protein IalB
MEQTAVLKQTGQVVTKVVLRVPAQTRAPVMMIQVPIGLYLPAGITVQIDAKKPQQFPVQTCDMSGCFAGTQVAKELLDELTSGSQLSVIFQNASQEKITVPMALSNFGDAYNRIK